MRLTVVFGRRNERAAEMKLPCSTTLTKTSVSLRSLDMGRSLQSDRLARRRDNYFQKYRLIKCVVVAYLASQRAAGLHRCH